MAHRGLASLTFAALLVALPFLSIAVGTAGATNREVMNDSLEELLDSWSADTDIEVLVRFASAPTVYDLGHLENAGLEARHTFHVVPAVWAIGRPDAVWRMSLDPRVAWIEWNRPLHYMMENSTTSIRATEVWNSVIEDQSIQYPEIDGSGVTVVVVDSGVDAGHPDLDYKGKTIMNLKSNTDLAWIEVENSDTSSGHGTHVAGTVAGNGDASAGARKGVAPGARLIALSTGEAVAIINALGALEWVYDNSRPGNNPYNIRCATNSWGTAGAPYDPNDAIALVTEALTYENNVVVTFAAGNDGRGHNDGETLTTNPYSNTPAAISVAAYTRDGTGVTDFSSRGLKSDNATWPDIGAPGAAINSTRARLTLITMEVCIMALQSGNLYQCDPYYMAISGTSMATPHVAGEVALLYQAAPSLRVSDIHADYGSANNTSAEDIQNWFTNNRTRIHEVEAILKLSARMLPGNGTTASNASNNVPVWDNWTGMLGLKRDFAQGYGFTDMRAAVGLALTLQKMRAGNPKTTVIDAYYQWKGLNDAKTPVDYQKEFAAKTDTLVTGWSGEYTRYNDQNGKVLLVQNTTKYVNVPNGTQSVDLDLTYTRVNFEDLSLGTVSWMVEYPDGTSQQGALVGGSGHKSATLNAQGKEGTWKISVVGAGFRLQDRLPPYQFKEMRLPYQIGLRAHIATSADAPTVIEFNDYHAQFAQWRFFEDQATNQTANGSIVMTRPVFDMSRVQVFPGSRPAPPGPGIGGSWLIWLVLLVVIGAGVWAYNESRVRKGQPALSVMVQARKAAEKLKVAPAWDKLKRGVGGVLGRLKGGGFGAALKRQGGALKGLRAKLHLKKAS